MLRASSFEDESGPAPRTTATRREHDPIAAREQRRSKLTVGPGSTFSSFESEPSPKLNKKITVDKNARVKVNLAAGNGRINARMTGVIQNGNYAERDHTVSLENQDWTDEEDVAKLRRECQERGLATHGRMLAFSKIAMQNSLNKFDERERVVNHTAAHISDFTFDREATWRNKSSKASNKTLMETMDSMKIGATGAR